MNTQLTPESTFIDKAWWSPNLQKFLRKKPNFHKVYRDSKTGIWYLGLTDGKFYACAKFLGVLCGGKLAQTWAMSETQAARLEDRTDQFWKCANYFGRRMFRRWYWER